MVSSGLLLRLLHCKINKIKQLSSQVNENSNKQIFKKKKPRKVNLKKKNLASGKLCRVCLNPGDIPIFGNKNHNNISKEIQDFGGIDVKSDDSFPKYICNSCYSLLESAISLRKNAQESDSYLKLTQKKKKVKKSTKKLSSKSLASRSKRTKTQPSVSVAVDHFSDNDNDNDDDFSVNDLFDQIDFQPTYTEKKTKPESAPAAPDYHCERCELNFESNELYQAHIMSEEHDKKKTKCPICQQEFSFLYIKKHIKSHDANSQEQFICDVCGRIVKSKTYLIRHRATHTLDLPFKCPQCPYKGRFRENIKVHMKSHTGIKPFKCPHCPDRSFINSSNLNRHLLTHNKGKQEYKFKCDICEKGFHEKRKLRDHLKIEHAGIREHVCDVCGKAFGLRNHLMKHQIKVHKREPLYPGGRRPLYIIAQQVEEQMKYNRHVEIPRVHNL